MITAVVLHPEFGANTLGLCCGCWMCHLCLLGFIWHSSYTTGSPGSLDFALVWLKRKTMGLYLAFISLGSWEPEMVAHPPRLYKSRLINSGGAKLLAWKLLAWHEVGNGPHCHFVGEDQVPPLPHGMAIVVIPVLTLQQFISFLLSHLSITLHFFMHFITRKVLSVCCFVV